MTDPKPVVIDDPIAHKFQLDPDLYEELTKYRVLLADVGASTEYRTPLHADPFVEVRPLAQGTHGAVATDLRERFAALWMGLDRHGSTPQQRVPPHVDALAEMLSRLGRPDLRVGVDLASPLGDRTAVTVHRSGSLALVDGRTVRLPPVSVAIPRRNGRFVFEGDLMRFVVLDHSRARAWSGAPSPPTRSSAPPPPARVWRFVDPAALRPSSSAPIVCTDRLHPTVGQGWVRMSSTPRRPRR